MSERDVIFRETFLARFPKVQDREVLQRFGALALSWATGAEHSEEGKSTPTASALAAAAADLRHLSRYIGTVVEEVEGCVVGDAEGRLGKRARTWTSKAADLAREIEAAGRKRRPTGRQRTNRQGLHPRTSRLRPLQPGPISCRHEASTSGSSGGWRLSNSAPAMSARSSSGRVSAEFLSSAPTPPTSLQDLWTGLHKQ